MKRLKSKICLVGEKAVGKTSLVRRFVMNMFDEQYVTTIGTRVSKKEVHISMPDLAQNVQVDLMIWDIMGEKGFHELLKDAYFYGANGSLAAAVPGRSPVMRVERRGPGPGGGENGAGWPCSRRGPPELSVSVRSVYARYWQSASSSRSKRRRSAAICRRRRKTATPLGPSHGRWARSTGSTCKASTLKAATRPCPGKPRISRGTDPASSPRTAVSIPAWPWIQRASRCGPIPQTTWSTATSSPAHPGPSRRARPGT